MTILYASSASLLHSDSEANASVSSSFQNDCISVVFSHMPFLPWDNPDNLVSAEVEGIVRRLQASLLLFLILIGGPANVINMAVFYKQGLADRVNLCLFALALTDSLYLLTCACIVCEQVHLSFTSMEKYGPMAKFMFNSNLAGFMSFGFISPVLSAIIATERCLCVLNPLRFQRLVRTSTMAGIIAGVYVLVWGLFFIVAFRYRIGCLYDPTTNVVLTEFVEGNFYKAHKTLINYIDSVVFGVGLPGLVMLVVTTSTLITIVKLRQATKWRSDTCSSALSAKEAGVTRMLVGNSILFIVCSTPDAVNHLVRICLPEMKSGGRYHNFFLMALWMGHISIHLNATLNIFVYYTMGSRYRETFWALFGRKASSERGTRSTAAAQWSEKKSGHSLQQSHT